ncbi:MAG: ABC transporter ATP-binding protein [Breznakibacter sp.]
MIRTEKLSCGYGSRAVLTNISLCFGQGQLTCLMGRNGVGKTTLFKTVLGLLKPLGGQVYINGKRLHGYSPLQLAKQVSYVPQAHGNPFPFTATEVVMMGQYAHSQSFWQGSSPHGRRNAIECLEGLGVGHLADKLFSKISGGEKQMVLIARAMAQKPQFIAMDEPTSNLDMGNQHKVMQTARLLVTQGYGVIINTHQPDHAANYADQVVLLNNGGMAACGAPQDVMRSDVISEIYNTKVEMLTARTSCGKIRSVCVAI